MATGKDLVAMACDDIRDAINLESSYRQLLIVLMERIDRVTMWNDVVWLDSDGDEHPARQYVRQLESAVNEIRKALLCKEENGARRDDEQSS